MTPAEYIVRLELKREMQDRFCYAMYSIWLLQQCIFCQLELKREMQGKRRNNRGRNTSNNNKLELKREMQVSSYR